MSAMHSLTVGQTMSGKTLCNQALARVYQQRGIGVVVLDRMTDPAWRLAGCEKFFMCTDVDEFMSFVKDPDKCLQCALFVDDSGGAMSKYIGDFDWITTEARHFGHVTHLIAQRAQQVAINIRTQCGVLHAFNISPKDAKLYSEDFNDPEIANAYNLPAGQFYRKVRHQPIQRLRMW